MIRVVLQDSDDSLVQGYRLAGGIDLTPCHLASEVGLVSSQCSATDLCEPCEGSTRLPSMPQPWSLGPPANRLRLALRAFRRRAAASLRSPTRSCGAQVPRSNGRARSDAGPLVWRRCRRGCATRRCRTTDRRSWWRPVRGLTVLLHSRFVSRHAIGRSCRRSMAAGRQLANRRTASSIVAGMTLEKQRRSSDSPAGSG